MDKQTFIQKATVAQATYQPSTEVKDQLSGLTLVAFIGPTGVGKSTIIEWSNIHYVISDMTRELRKDEEDGIDIHQRHDYDELWSEIENGLFVQFLVSHFGEFYGTKVSSYPTAGMCTLPVVASAITVFEAAGFKQIIKIYVMPPSYEAWMERVQKQHVDGIAGRLVEAKESLSMALGATDYIYLINDEVGQALRDVKSIIAGTYSDQKSADSKALIQNTYEELLKKSATAPAQE